MAEAAAYTRRGFLGGAKASTISGDLNDSATTIPGADLSTWAGATANGPICWTINRGKADEESGEATGISGNNLTGVTRGLFGTSAQAHDSGATLELTSSKKDFDEANAHIADTTLDHHTQYLNTARHNALDHSTALGTAVLADLSDVASTAPSDGQVLTYDTTNGWQPETLAGGGATIVRKAANESVTSSTTMQNDDELTFTCSANTTRVGKVVVFVNTGAEAADIAVGMSTSTGSMRWGVAGLASGATDNTGSANFFSGVSGGSVAVAVDDTWVTMLVLYFTVTAGVTDATVTFRWAQVVSNATATTVLAGSHLTHQAV